MYDYHTHHYRCGHAEGKLEEYIERAREKGLRNIGLSDHSPIYHLGDDPHVRPSTAMAWGALPGYLQECVELKRHYCDTIEVRVGVESDYLPGWESHYRSLWATDDLDYVIGSVHWVDDWHIFSKSLPKGQSYAAVFHAYLERIQGAAKSGIYNILGHIDAIKVWDLMPKTEFVAAYKETLRTIADEGVAIELNTSGWRKVCKEQFPSREILTEANRLGIPVCLGSDAHAPDLVGADFDRALALLKEIGFTSLATFADKEMHLIPLSEVDPCRK